MTIEEDAPAPATIEVEAAAPAISETDAPAPAVSRADAPHTHAFAPAALTARPEEACGEARVGFVRGSSVLDAAARGRLDVYAACVVTDRAHALYISGTTDPGSSATTMGLASARARAVADYLHEDGLHMDFEIHAYRAGGVGPAPGRRETGRSASVTTTPPRRATE